MSVWDKAYLVLVMGGFFAFIAVVMYVHLYLNVFHAKDRDDRRNEPHSAPIAHPKDKQATHKLAA